MRVAEVLLFHRRRHPPAQFAHRRCRNRTRRRHAKLAGGKPPSPADRFAEHPGARSHRSARTDGTTRYYGQRHLRLLRCEEEPSLNSPVEEEPPSRRSHRPNPRSKKNRPDRRTGNTEPPRPGRRTSRPPPSKPRAALRPSARLRRPVSALLGSPGHGRLPRERHLRRHLAELLEGGAGSHPARGQPGERHDRQRLGLGIRATPSPASSSTGA